MRERNTAIEIYRSEKIGLADACIVRLRARRPRDEDDRQTEPRTFSDFQLPPNKPYVWGTLCHQYDWQVAVALRHAPRSFLSSLRAVHLQMDARVCLAAQAHAEHAGGGCAGDESRVEVQQQSDA